MADNKKYYYMRLNENYFDSETQVLLESMPDGYLYSNILLKLYLKSLKNDGKLVFNEKIPYSPQMIATITRHQVGTVEKALKIFKDLNIIDIIDSGAIYMLDIQNFIGKSNNEADRKRAYRNRIIKEKGQMSLNCPLELELELELEKEIDFIIPTLEEVKKYCQQRNNGIDAERFMEHYNTYGWVVGKDKKPMKSWKLAILTWEQNAKKEQKENNKTPEWFDKKNKKENISKEERKELEELLKDFK